MIGFIWPIFRRVSEVNSTAITAQLVLTQCLGSHAPQHGAGNWRMAQPWSPSTGCRMDPVGNSTAASSLLPLALLPFSPVQPRAGAALCWPWLQTLPVLTAHGTQSPPSPAVAPPACQLWCVTGEKPQKHNLSCPLTPQEFYPRYRLESYLGKREKIKYSYWPKLLVQLETPLGSVL